MSKDLDHIWLDNVGGPKARGERALYFGRRRREPKMQVRIFSEGSGVAPAHTDVVLTDQQARELAVWIVANLMQERS